jgi:hypothetical protein
MNSLKILNDRNLKCVCGKCNLVASIESKKHIPKTKNNLLYGKFYVYTCHKCNEMFTTTQSDELSIIDFKHK